MIALDSMFSLHFGFNFPGGCFSQTIHGGTWGWWPTAAVHTVHHHQWRPRFLRGHKRPTISSRCEIQKFFCGCKSRWYSWGTVGLYQDLFCYPRGHYQINTMSCIPVNGLIVGNIRVYWENLTSGLIVGNIGVYWENLTSGLIVGNIGVYWENLTSGLIVGNIRVYWENLTSGLIVGNIRVYWENLTSGLKNKISCSRRFCFWRYITKGAYFTFKSIFHKALNLF